MEQIFNSKGYPIDTNKLYMLSDRGTEFIVYRYFDLVIKLFRQDYKLTHITLEELEKLKQISTKRILLPTDILLNKDGNLVGYTMPLIVGKKNIDTVSMHNFFEELKILEQDLNILCHNSVILRDINLPNTIYNGKIYLIDPGNYLINDLNKVLYNVNISSLTQEEKTRLLMQWNYNKINILIDMLLFSPHVGLDTWRYKEIVTFLANSKKENNLLYNLDILEMIFDPNLCIGEAINEFLDQFQNINTASSASDFNKLPKVMSKNRNYLKQTRI